MLMKKVAFGAWASLILVTAHEDKDLLESSSCTICKGTQNVGLPSKTLDLSPLGEFQCGSINQVLGVLVPNASDPVCEMVQSFGSMCGCKVREDEETGCNFCKSNSLGFPQREIPGFDDLSATPSIAVTCEKMQAYYFGKADKGDSTCRAVQWAFADYCGCTAINTEWHEPCTICPEGEPMASPDQSINITNLPYSTCGELVGAVELLFIKDSRQCNTLQPMLQKYCGCPVDLEEEKEEEEGKSCNLCADGSDITTPDKEVDFFKTMLEDTGFSGWTPTCAMVDSFVASLSKDSLQCKAMQLTGSYCGCPAIQDSCDICPGESIPVEFYNKKVTALGAVLRDTDVSGLPLTCEMAAIIQDQISKDDQRCHLAFQRRDLCGCNNEEFHYNGANTVFKRGLLAWTPRISASLSIVGSSLIICDVVRSPKKRYRKYNQLVLVMSVFDLISNIASALTTLPIPTHDWYGNEWKIYGARGNIDTCKAQGFFLQWAGMTSLLFNASLAAYYMLVFVFGWKDESGSKGRRWLILFIPPMVIGLALAIAGIPHYDIAFYTCMLHKPIFGESKLPLLIFVIPAALSLALSNIMTISVYFAIQRRTVGTDRANSINAERVRRIEHEVFWQSVFYLGAFYFVWPMLIFGFLDDGAMKGNARGYFFHLVLAFLIPFQGFLNAVVYFRPRFRRWAEKRRRRKPKPRPSILSNVLSSLDIASASASNESHFDSGPFLDEAIEPSALVARNIEEEIQEMEGRLFDGSFMRNLPTTTIPEETMEESKSEPSENDHGGM